MQMLKTYILDGIQQKYENHNESKIVVSNRKHHVSQNKISYRNSECRQKNYFDDVDKMQT